jgi:hypothetical protein
MVGIIRSDVGTFINGFKIILFGSPAGSLYNYAASVVVVH